MELFGGELGAVDRSLEGCDEENLLLVSLILCCLGEPDDELCLGELSPDCFFGDADGESCGVRRGGVKEYA
jgi:hypothetical protein